MGCVYEATQLNPRRKVALKVIAPGLASDSILKRFEFEAQLLGRLEHHGIARIYEAGTATTALGEQPYFAMELVDGQPVTAYADSKALGVKERLRVLAEICEAMQHAHQKGIIHRDLKPANIFVDGDGQPKILDFGVAKLANPDEPLRSLATQEGKIIGTLPYMSPEQVEANPLKVDTRADVYALGVLGFELLTGRLPHDLEGKSLHGMIVSIRDTPPPLLGNLDRQLRGDVETIIGKALEKEKDRRYATAGELWADVGRFLRDEPIIAQPPTTLYQLRKFARRNRALVAGVVIAFLAVVGGAIGVSWQEIVATRERDIAERRLAQAEAVKDFLRDMFLSLDPEKDGREAKVIHLLERKEGDLEAAFGDQPRVAAALSEAMGVAFLALGLFDKADRHLQHALDLRVQHGAEKNELADSYFHMALLLVEKSEYREAEELLIKAIQLEREFFGPNDLRLTRTQSALATLLGRQGKFEEAVKIHEEIVRRRREETGNTSDVVADALVKLGSSLTRNGSFGRAEEVLRESVVTSKSVYGEAHLRYAEAEMQLAAVLLEKDAFQEAESLFREALKTNRDALSEDHPRLVTVLTDLATILSKRGAHREAKPFFAEALEIDRRTRRNPGYERFKILISLANIELHFEKSADTAILSLEHALTIGRKIYSGPHVDIGETLDSLAIAHQWRRENDTAKRYHEEALTMYRQALPAGPHPTLADCLFNLGAFHTRTTKDYHAAEKYLREAKAIETELRGPAHHYVAEIENEIAKILLIRSGDLAEAERLLRHAADVFLTTFGDSYKTSTALYGLARCAYKREQYGEAEEQFRRVVAMRKTMDPPAPLDLADGRTPLAQTLVAQEKFDEAEEVLLDNDRHFVTHVIGDDHRMARGNLEVFVRLYLAKGDKEKAAEYQARLESGGASQ